MTDTNNIDIASNSDFIEYLKKKRMHRIVFSSITLFLYAIFAFGYGPLYGLFISEVSEQSQLNFALLYFLFLVVAFFVLELIYTKLANGMESNIRQVLYQADHNNEL
ncbi:hypothetical protein [Dasania marina]|uniref:hypothetical protein n=1 Tax=Dasania marina TaxID=471499 RepID=UPI0030D97EBC|tara:strand:- start:157223 stop:157543 length:321 start_codon:yes stop_codon:yes gene_type:complete